MYICVDAPPQRQHVVAVYPSRPAPASSMLDPGTEPLLAPLRLFFFIHSKALDRILLQVAL